MAELCIEGHLDVNATREARLVEDLCLPVDWIDKTRPKSPNPRVLRCAPILLRDRHGALEPLNWQNPTAVSPNLSPWDRVEVWIIDERDLEDEPGLIKAIRFCLYQLTRIKSNIKSSKKSKELRHEILEKIDSDLELRSAIARHILHVEEIEVLLPRNILPLLGNQIDSRTLQKDLANIRGQEEISAPDSQRIGSHFSDAAEIPETGIDEQSTAERHTEKGDGPETLFANRKEENIPGWQKGLDSSAGEEFLGQENRGTTTGNDETNESIDPGEQEARRIDESHSDTVEPARARTGASGGAPSDEAPRSSEEETEYKGNSGLPSAEDVTLASRLYTRLLEVDADLPEFERVMDALRATKSDESLAKKKVFIGRLIELEEEIESAPSPVAARVKKFLGNTLPSHEF